MIRVLLPFLKLFRRQWLLMLAGMALSLCTLLAGIGLLSLSGWFLSATAIAGLTVITADAFNFFTPSGGVRFLSIMRTASRYGERIVTHEATFKLLTELRVWLWQKMMPLSDKTLSGLRQGDLLNRLVADIDTLDHLYLRLLTPLCASLAMIGLLYFGLSLFDPQLAAQLCLALLAAWFILPWLFYGLGKTPGREIVQAKRHYRVALLDYVQGQAELSLYKAKPRYRRELEAHELTLLQAQGRMASITALSQAALIIASGAVLLLMLWTAAEGVGSAQPPGALYALMVFAALGCVEMLMPLAGAFQHLSSCVLAATRLTELTEQAPDIEFVANSVAIERGAVTISQLSFGYQPTQLVLSDLQLTVAAGEKVGIVGQTGAGKSTLLQLLTRQWLFDTDSQGNGEICLDGRPLQDYSETALRRGIGVISQRVHLFSGTVRENLLVGAVADEQGKRPAISDQRLIEVLEQVGLQTLTQGEQPLNVWLGDGGRQLSGGELRRIGIARVLLGDAPLWLLDEPTEGLDSQTEAEIMALLHRQGAEKTWLLISHRRSILTQMDAIYQLQNGQLNLYSPSANITKS